MAWNFLRVARSWRRGELARALAPRKRHRPAVEALEDRTLLAVVSWAVNASGDWNTAADWLDDQGVHRVPTAGDIAIINRTVPVTVTVDSAAQAQTLQASSTQTLTLASGGSLTITASSTISGPFTLDAGAALTVDGGTLTFQGSTFTDNGGVISVSTGAAVDLTGGHNVAYVGTFTASGGGSVLMARGQLDASKATFNFPPGMFSWSSGGISSLTNTGSVTVVPGGNSAPGLGGTITNSGTIEVQPGLYLDVGGATLQGTGQVLMEPGSNYSVLQAQSGTTLTIGQGQTVLSKGGGYLAGAVVNQGTVRATGAGNYLILNDGSAASTNSGTIEALNGGEIEVISGTLDNSVGTIQADHGTVDTTGGATVTGGYLTLRNSSTLINGDPSFSTIRRSTLTLTGGSTLTGSNGSLANITIPTGSDLLVQAGSGQSLGGTITNDGTIELQAGTGLSTGVVTLQGTGQVVMDPGSSYSVLGQSGSALTIAAGQTVLSRGGGYLVGALVNQGLVEATGASNYLILNDGNYASTNSGTVQALNGGEIQVIGGILDNGVGTIQADQGTILNTGGTTISGGPLLLTNGSTLAADGGTITGSTLTLTGGSMVTGNGTGTLTNITIPPGSDFLVPAGPGVWLSGAITNDGTVELQPTGGNVLLELAGSVTLQGTGRVVMDPGSGYSQVRINDSALMIAPGQTVLCQGGGYLNGPVDNQGLVQVTGAGNYMIIEGGAASNSATIEALNGGSVTISSTVAQVSGSALTGGTWDVLGGSTLRITSVGNITTNHANVTLSGAGSTFTSIDALTTNAGSFSVLAGATFTTVGDFTNSGNLAVGPGSTLTVGGTYTQSSAGSLNVQLGGPPASGSFGQLKVSGAAALDGTLGVGMTDGYVPLKNDTFQVMSYPQETGSFATYQGLMAGRLQLFKAVVGGTGVQITALIDAADLAVTAVTVPATGVPGQNVSITYSVQNTQNIPTAVDSWIDSVYLSASPTFDPSAKLIGRVQHNGGVAASGNYSETLTAPLPGVVPGNYYVIVIANSRGLLPDVYQAKNILASTSPISVSIPALTAGTPTSGTIDNGQDVYYQVNLSPGPAVRITAGFGAAAGGDLYVRYQDAADPATFDQVASDPTRRTQQVLLTAPQAGTYYILLHGREGSTGGKPFTLTVQQLTFGILGVSPSQGGNSGQVTVTVQGAGLTPSTVVSLVGKDGVRHASLFTLFQNGGSLFATFDLTGLSLGAYDVRVDDRTHTDTDSGAFTVITGQPGNVVYNMSAPEFVRDGTMGTVTVTYENVGTTDAPAPLLALIGTNAVLRLPDEAAFAGSTVQFLAIDPSGPAGVLPPGTPNHITLYFQASTTAPVGSSISFELGLAATDQPIDWASTENDLKPLSVPADAWPPIWNNFLASVGSTAGSLQTALDRDATYVSRFGEYNPDITPLLSFELQKADDFGAITQRYTQGAFGRGWPDPTDIRLTTDTAGNVTLSHSGQVRLFFIQADGSYQGVPGDTATLTRAQDGSYQLRETDGTITAFNPDGTLNYTQDTNSNRITAGYTNGQLTEFMDSTKDTVQFQYNSQGRITQVTDPVGRVTTYTYDSTGQELLSVADPTGTTTYTYEPGQGAADSFALQSITYPDNSQTLFRYNAQGQLTSQEADQAGDEQVTYSYDEGGVSVTDAAGGTSTYFLNEFQQVAAYQDPLGNLTHFGFDANHNRVTETGPDGITSTFTNDARGNPTGLVDPSGNQLHATYDPTLNRLTGLTDPNGNATQYRHDSNGNLLSIAYPDSSQEQFTYDPTGNLKDSVDRNGTAISYAYDTHHLLTEEDFPDGSKITYSYDTRRNLTAATNSVGKTSFQYDSADRLLKVTYPNGMFLQFTYNAAGQRIKMVDQTGFTVNYQYDAVGRLFGLTDGSGNPIVQYHYDAAGRLSEKDMGNGTYTTYSYDLSGNLTAIVNHGPRPSPGQDGPVISQFAYQYDDLGRPVSVTTLQGTTTYGYDATGQLTSVTLPGGRTITYEYDAAGNRKRVIDNGMETDYTTNNLDEYTQVGATQYAYDKAGNLISQTDASGTTTYSYDALGQLVGVVSPQGTWAYQYDALGNRIAVTQNGQETQYLIDPTGIGNLTGEFDGSGNIVAHYTQGIGLISRVDPTGTAAYYNFDLTGNTTELTGNAGSVLNTYSYLPFGEILSPMSTALNPFKYGGELGVATDGNGLYFMHNRFLDITLGRFSTPDPLGIAGGAANPYKYAANSPSYAVDPSGLAPVWVPSGAGTIWTPPGAGTIWTPPGAGTIWTPPGAGTVWTPPGAGSIWTPSGEVPVLKQPVLKPPPEAGEAGLSLYLLYQDGKKAGNTYWQVKEGKASKWDFVHDVGLTAADLASFAPGPLGVVGKAAPVIDEASRAGFQKLTDWWYHVDESPVSAEALRQRRLGLRGKLIPLPIFFEDL